jgi:HEPN domain-containing protein
MPTKQQLRDLANLRLREAEVLFTAGLYDGAAYLCGYVIELALKARICRVLDANDYPDGGKYKQVYAVHDFAQLLLFLSGLRPKMDPGNATLFNNWSIAVPWNPERRYSPPGTYSKQDAEEILDAIRDKNDGILRWIKKYW